MNLQNVFETQRKLKIGSPKSTSFDMMTLIASNGNNEMESITMRSVRLVGSANASGFAFTEQNEPAPPSPALMVLVIGARSGMYFLNAEASRLK
jgi:hypothetical protein